MQEWERDIINCVIDEANKIYWEFSIKSEKEGHKLLLKRLRALGYQVSSEHYIAQIILGDLQYDNRLDLLIEDRVAVELKHADLLEGKHKQQLAEYMDLPALRKKHGVLVVFPKFQTPPALMSASAERLDGQPTIHFESKGPRLEAYSHREELLWRRYNL